MWVSTVGSADGVLGVEAGASVAGAVTGGGSALGTVSPQSSPECLAAPVFQRREQDQHAEDPRPLPNDPPIGRRLARLSTRSLRFFLAQPRRTTFRSHSLIVDRIHGEAIPNFILRRRNNPTLQIGPSDVPATVLPTSGCPDNSRILPLDCPLRCTIRDQWNHR